LISSRDASNVRSQSAKSKVKRAFHLHKAGIQLSTADHDLLFSERKHYEDDDNVVEPDEDSKARYSDLFAKKTGRNDEASSSASDDMRSAAAKKTSTAPTFSIQPPATALPSAQPVPAASLGLSLLQQIALMKQGHLASQAKDEESDSEEPEEDTPSSHTEQVYVPVEMELPVDSFGNVKKGAAWGTGEGKEDGPASTKRRFIVDRDPEIQVKTRF
jgi:hypothetical protein